MVERESLQILMDCPEEPAEEFTRFIKYLGELKSQINTRMTTTVEDEAASRTTLHELTDRERLMEESRDALKQKLAEVREEKEHVTLSLDQMLKKLQLELQDITQVGCDFLILLAD
jgi:vacuolar-type H+-ATPase subunit E/Vma4